MQMRLFDKKINRYLGAAFLIILVCLLTIWWYSFFARTGACVIVELNGVETARFSLKEDTVYRIETGDGHYNILEIIDGEAFVSEADCAGQDCVHFAPISHAGQTIVCLPHKLNIYITADTEQSGEREYDAMAN